MRRLTRPAAAAVLAVAVSVLSASAAHAADAPPGPPAENPLATSFTMVWGSPSTLPKPGDPFNPADHATFFEQYGPAGLWFNVYDIQGPDPGAAIRGAAATVFFGVTNLVNGIPRFVMTLVAALADAVLNPESWLASLNSTVDSASNALTSSLGVPGLTAAFLLVGIGLVVHARKQRLGKAATRGVFLLAALGMVGVAVNGPSHFASLYSNTLSKGVQGVLGAQSGRAVVGPMWTAAVYKPWCLGTIGTGPVADKYCPRFAAASALTLTEAAALQAMPRGTDDEKKAAAKALQDVLDKKEALFQSARADLEKEDKAAYQRFQGEQYVAAAGTSVVTWLVAICCLPFLLAALAMALAGMLAIYLLAALLPLLAVMVAFFPGMLKRLGQLVLATIVNTFVFTAASIAILRVADAVLASTNLGLGVLIVAGMSVLAWLFLKPFRRVGRMVKPQPVDKTLETTKERTSKVTKKVGKKAVAKITGAPVKAGKDGKPGEAVKVNGSGADPAGTPPGADAPKPPVPATAPYVGFHEPTHNGTLAGFHEPTAESVNGPSPYTPDKPVQPVNGDHAPVNGGQASTNGHGILTETQPWAPTRNVEAPEPLIDTGEATPGADLPAAPHLHLIYDPDAKTVRPVDDTPAEGIVG